MRRGRTRLSGATITFNTIGYFFLTILTVICFVPFLLVLSGSFTENSVIIRYGYQLWPKVFSLDAYRYIFIFPTAVIDAYEVSIFVTVVGTVGGVLLMAMAGYVLQRKEIKYRSAISFFFYFTTLFNCGLVPWYMLVVGLGMKNTVSSLIIPNLESVFSILLVRNFMKTIPESLVESAKIDGGGDFLIFWRIVLPLSKPVLATIGLFLALTYWNDWFSASLFIQNVHLYPLQFLLYRTLSDQQVMTTAGAAYFRKNVLPTESVKLATAVITTGPIIILYPFLQKYFVQGITIGAVKG